MSFGKEKGRKSEIRSFRFSDFFVYMSQVSYWHSIMALLLQCESIAIVL